jgi:hypothetical protein
LRSETFSVFQSVIVFSKSIVALAAFSSSPRHDSLCVCAGKTFRGNVGIGELKSPHYFAQRSLHSISIPELSAAKLLLLAKVSS